MRVTVIAARRDNNEFIETDFDLPEVQGIDQAHDQALVELECAEQGWAMLSWAYERADNDEQRAQHLAILDRVRRIDSLLDHLDGCLQGLEDLLTEPSSGPQQTSPAAKPRCARQRLAPARRRPRRRRSSSATSAPMLLREVRGRCRDDTSRTRLRPLLTAAGSVSPDRELGLSGLRPTARRCVMSRRYRWTDYHLVEL